MATEGTEQDAKSVREEAGQGIQRVIGTVALGQILHLVWLYTMPRLGGSCRRIAECSRAAAKGTRVRNGQELAARRNRGLSKGEKSTGSRTRNPSSAVPLVENVNNRVGVARGYFMGH